MKTTRIKSFCCKAIAASLKPVFYTMLITYLPYCHLRAQKKLDIAFAELQKSVHRATCPIIYDASHPFGNEMFADGGLQAPQHTIPAVAGNSICTVKGTAAKVA